MHDLFLALGFGLVTASIVAISTVALSLQYSVTDIPNFAHGELMTIGAYGAFITQSHINNLLVEGLVSAVLGGVLAWLMNAAVLQPFMRAGAKRLVLFIVTIAVGLIIQNIVLIIYGGASLAFTLPSSAPHHVGPLLLTSRDEWIIAAGVIAMLLIHVLLRYTKFGKAQRAVSDSRALARTTGINVDQIVQLTWLLAGAMAGFAGFVLGASVGTLSPTLGFSFLLVIFAAGIVGGIGKPYGAMAGALLIGMAMEISALYLPADYKEVIAFGLLILTLLVRPYGLFTTVRGVPQ